MMIWLWGNGSLIYSKTNLLYYLPMERMSELNLEKTMKLVFEKNKRITELEEENKNLKRELEDTKQVSERDYNIVQNDNNILRNENKKLKSDLAFERTMLDNVKAEYKSLQDINKKLNEKVRFLEECLDRKENLNEKYRKELEELKSTYVYDAKQVRDIC